MKKVNLKGMAGKALELTIEKRMKTVDYKLLVEPFAKRYESDGAWRCEFWGKIVRSAIQCAYISEDPELRKLVDETVQDLLNTQTPDGCISSYPTECQTQGWDIWGRKYAFLALLRYYELLDQDPKILSACCKAMDYLMTQVGEGKNDIIWCGRHDGLAASSILGAVVALYRLTKEQKYRDFAEYIMGRGCSYYGNIFECADTGAVPATLGNGKAYEMTSCFQGLAELLLFEPNEQKIKMLRKYYDAVLEREIFVTGTGAAKDACGEYWFDGAFKQTRSDCGALGETCVTSTWMRYCYRLLQLTDDSTIADELEKSLYNALIGALNPDGSHWVHANPTPLTGKGYKWCAKDQIEAGFKTPYGGNDCCRAQGPEGLAMSADFAVMRNPGCVTVNLFEPMEAESLVITGNYPYDPAAELEFSAQEACKLRLRTPSFLKKVVFNGKEVSFEKGKYLALDHAAGTTDKIALEFDFTLQEIPSPDGHGFVAVKRGPLVLAADSRGHVPEAKVSVQWNGLELCEYAVAGNLMNENNTLTVWFKK